MILQQRSIAKSYGGRGDQLPTANVDAKRGKSHHLCARSHNRSTSRNNIDEDPLRSGDARDFGPANFAKLPRPFDRCCVKTLANGTQLLLEFTAPRVPVLDLGVKALPEIS